MKNISEKSADEKSQSQEESFSSHLSKSQDTLDSRKTSSSPNRKLNEDKYSEGNAFDDFDTVEILEKHAIFKIEKATFELN